MLEAPDFFYEREIHLIIVSNCERCDEPICEGEQYFRVDGKDYCKECIEDCKTFAEG